MTHQPAAIPPSPLDRFTDFVSALAGCRPAVFLDYDGTLTPIADRPDLAVLDPTARAVVSRLAGLCPVSIVSGRDRADVAALVGLPTLVYAGSHGFDVAGPGIRVEIGGEALPALDGAEAALRAALADTAGALVERKRFAVAVHTRLVAPAEKPAVAATVRAALSAAAGLRLTGGKEIHELRPDLPWDKGRAVLDLLGRLGFDEAATVPLYIGDDETDEDAFRALAGRGLSIRVMERPAATAAGWSLPEPAAVAGFLARLAEHLERRGS